MEIIFNTDKNIEGKQRLENYFKSQLNEDLRRFSERITRLEVHLSDENADKKGERDKKCVLEARLEGMKPIAVSAYDESIEKCVSAASQKMKSSLSKVIEKLQDH